MAAPSDAEAPSAETVVAQLADPAAARRRPPAIAPAPRWVAPVFLALALALVPWTIWLGANLPSRVVSAHWALAWVGFDVGIFVALSSTAWCAYRRSPLVAIAATAAATLLTCDAWFDVTTSRQADEVIVAIVEALLVELPLAMVCLWIAAHAEGVSERTTLFLARYAARRTR